jgi:uncharacterized membrane protein
MAQRRTTPERLAAFSDGVIAIIITIMVLELKVPHEASLQALSPLWPVFLSYALSYLFVGVFWVNHHHLLHLAKTADHMVVWANLLVLFFVSLIPFFTEYMAETHLHPFATALYAGIFLLVTVAFILLQKVIARQFGSDPELQAMDRAANKRNWIALVAYGAAIPAAWLHPAVTLLIILLIAAAYFIPDAFSRKG